MLRTHTKTTTSYQHRVIEDHEYDWMAGKNTIEVGRVLRITKTPNRYDVYNVVLGTGYSTNIPQNKIGVFKLDEKIVTTIRETLCENI
jgi:hypothetical protein